MEACLEAVSPARLWWTKLGKWQALMVVLTLGVFFVTLGITGDAKDAAIAAIAAFAFAAAIAIAVADGTPDINRKMVWLSYAGEFLIISLPVLWALR